jgi:hypothetical protein
MGAHLVNYQMGQSDGLLSTAARDGSKTFGDSVVISVDRYHYRRFGHVAGPPAPEYDRLAPNAARFEDERRFPLVKSQVQPDGIPMRVDEPLDARVE